MVFQFDQRDESTYLQKLYHYQEGFIGYHLTLRETIKFQV